jgi:hypothetical protein
VAATNSIVNTPTMVTWDSEVYDDGNRFAANRFQAPTAGLYHFDVLVSIIDMDRSEFMEITMRVGVTTVTRAYANTGRQNMDISAYLSTDVKLNANDLVSIWILLPVVKSTATGGLRTQFSGRKIY